MTSESVPASALPQPAFKEVIAQVDELSHYSRGRTRTPWLGPWRTGGSDLKTVGTFGRDPSRCHGITMMPISNSTAPTQKPSAVSQSQTTYAAGPGELRLAGNNLDPTEQCGFQNVLTSMRAY